MPLRWAGPAVIGIAVVLAYAGSFTGAFIFDDHQSVVSNPSIRRLDDWRAVLTPDSGTTAGRPLLNLTYALNYAWSGEAVWTYHAVNLLVHGLAALTLFGLVRRTLELPRVRSQFPGTAAGFATTVALVWAVHPLATEAVTYVSQRSESLMALCYLFVLYAFVRSRHDARPRRWLAASVVANLAGIAVKEVMVTAPLVLLLFDAAFVTGSLGASLRQRRGYYLALAVSWVELTGLMLAFPISGRGVGFGFAIDPLTYAATECQALAQYLRLALWPHPLVFDYGPNWGANGAAALGGVAAVAAALAGAMAAWRWSQPAGFLAGAFFLLLAPTSSIVPVALQPVAESRMYLPLAALVTLAVAAAWRGLPWRRGRIGATAAVVTALGLGTAGRNLAYASPVRMWADTVAKMPGNPRAHNSLGTAWSAEHRRNAAEREFRAALAADPHFAPAHFNLGATLLDAGRPAEALPHLAAARGVPNQQAQLLLYLGQAHLALNEPAPAIAPLQAALRLAPGDAETAFALGNALGALGRLPEAIAALQQAARAAPENARIRNNLGTALLLAHRVDEAVHEYQQALALRPADRSIRDNLDTARRMRAPDVAR